MQELSIEQFLRITTYRSHRTRCSVTTDTSTAVDGCHQGQKELHNREEKQTRTQTSYICCCLLPHVVPVITVLIPPVVIRGTIAAVIISLAVFEFGIISQGHSIANEHSSSNDTSKDGETHKTSNLVRESRKYIQYSHILIKY